MKKITITIKYAIDPPVKVETDSDFCTEDDEALASMILSAAAAVEKAARRKLKEGVPLDPEGFRRRVLASSAD